MADDVINPKFIAGGHQQELLIKTNLLQHLLKPHVDSFDEFLDNGLINIIKNLQPAEFKINEETKIKIFIEDAELTLPSHTSDMSSYIYPRECRIKGTSYKGRLLVRLAWTINDVYQNNISREIAQIPVLIKSKRCNIQSFTPDQLVKYGEEENEQGGYFICQGIERIIRMLIIQRRNYPLAFVRDAWKGKVSGLTEYGISVRSVNDNNHTVMNVLHYCKNSTMLLSISHKKRQYFVPFFIVLKLLVSFNDYKIYTHFLYPNKDDTLWKDSAKCMLSALNNLNIKNSYEAKKYIGEAFRFKLDLPSWYSDEKIAEFLIDKCICIHLDNYLDKFNFLIFMAHKLMALIDKKIVVESPDTINNQEVLLPGQVYQIILQDKLQTWLNTLQARILHIFKKNHEKNLVFNTSHIVLAISKCYDISTHVEYFLKSGNIKSKNGLGLPQITGFTIVVDKINYIRFLSHFRSIHRGVYFTHSYSTKVRKLLPECWGFLCPVHTPDGSPCGLLNHLTYSCDIVTQSTNLLPYVNIIKTHANLFTDISNIDESNFNQYISVHMDGNILGFIHNKNMHYIVDKLNEFKITQFHRLEICLVPSNNGCMYPGIYIFSSSARFIRPVMNRKFDSVEWIGTFEQIFLDISLKKEDIQESPSTHYEIDDSYIFSVTAALTPFSDCNQSPRNMYQCQMMKQSMGVSMHTFKYHFDNKIYRLLTPQSPICKNTIYDKISLDDYPIGMNAVLAVISYTGYDMEDAMIINQAAIDRGFANGTVYKTIDVDLNKLSQEAESNKESDHIFVFGCQKTDKCYYDHLLDMDGLPPIGRLIRPHEPIYSYYDVSTDEYVVKLLKMTEYVYVDDVAIIEVKPEGITKVNIRLRICRDPVVGDKFSSRHGQKGILSIMWPAQDMPFTENGIIPDIIFNPHGMPSRMTIGMMIEIMASKVGALQGTFINSDPFKCEDSQSLIESFGQMLTDAGYNYYGSEKMYSGINGEELQVEIFTGIVYYQRLRHMVSDKYQVRSVGPVDTLTRQPVHGRKKGGGIRFGEMERDGLISHGCSYLLQDRLFDCSDKSLSFICQNCGDLLATKLDPKRSFNPLIDFKPPSVVENKNALQFVCLLCNSSANVKPIHLPYSFRYLLVELASMNIRVKLSF